MENEVLSIILGGGQGTRLFPLTEQRSKPAVQFGGKYRLIDVPISNCINSDLRRIFILTQFNSASLNFHISSTYQLDTFSGGFIYTLSAEQRPDRTEWYRGTADAVRKNLYHFTTSAENYKYYLILSGDQLYRMNFRKFHNEHLKSGAELSLGILPVSRERAGDLGILQIDEKGFITKFVEKPGATADISELKIPDAYRKAHNIPAEKEYLASMGIYFFNRDTLEELLASDKDDFGHDIIPNCIGKLKVSSYLHQDYWEDIGTIKSFYEANLDLASPVPAFNMYDAGSPLYTRRLDLPPSKINQCTINNSITSEGSIISGAFIQNSLIGIRTIIREGASLEGVLCMGADFYETAKQIEQNAKEGIPNVGIGSGSIIKGTIIDKNARIGRNCRIGIDQLKRKDGDYSQYMIRDGIIVLRKNAVLKDGTSI
ncbi:MAG: glucose-1-phosphate adenylyltransferase [Spirochaetaceae bacterium]|nr:glucose-1-phosphate adenylyltransferase [Spirochaetaceae bacterium]